jgi:hypothetical protein
MIIALSIPSMRLQRANSTTSLGHLRHTEATRTTCLTLEHCHLLPLTTTFDSLALRYLTWGTAHLWACPTCYRISDQCMEAEVQAPTSAMATGKVLSMATRHELAHFTVGLIRGCRTTHSVDLKWLKFIPVCLITANRHSRLPHNCRTLAHHRIR